MKRFVALLLTLLSVLSYFPLSVSATVDLNENVNYIYYEDGSFLKITVTQSITRSTGTKTGQKNL